MLSEINYCHMHVYFLKRNINFKGKIMPIRIKASITYTEQTSLIRHGLPLSSSVEEIA